MKNTFTQVSRLCLVISVLVYTLFPADAAAQVALTRDMHTYKQDFNALPSSTTGIWEHGGYYFPGWTLHRTYTAVSSVLVGSGTSNAGGLYSYGQTGSTERALGAVSSTISRNLSQFAWGFVFQNNTGSPITSLTISYTGEQWRSGSSTAGPQATTFWHSQSATSPNFDLSSRSDVGWTNVPELNFNSIVNFGGAGALNGNLAANRTFLIASIQVNIPQGHYFMLRWKDLNDLDDDHGLAIDDFSLTWSNSGQMGPIPMPVEMLYFKSNVTNGQVKLEWATASEKNSSHFEVQRSSDGVTFKTIGSIPAKGYSSVKAIYRFTDEDPLVSTSYYRLKQVDLDDTFEISKLVAVHQKGPVTYSAYPTKTNGDIQFRTPASSTATPVQIYDKMGRLIVTDMLPAAKTNHTVNLSRLTPGNYVVALIGEKGQKHVFRIIKY